MRKEHSIKRKLSLSYILYILIVILFVGVLSNFVIGHQYRQYVEQKEKAKINEIMTQLSNQYTTQWNVDNIDLIGTNEINNGYIISVYDVNGQKIWAAEDENSSQCKMMLNDIKTRMLNQNPHWNGRYQLKEYPVVVNHQTIGTAKIGYYGPYFYTQQDFTFLMTLNTLYLILSIIFILFSLILGTYMAKRLSNPIRKMVKATSNITKGIYEKIPRDRSNIMELNQLTTSINSLTETLKNQEELRKQLTSDVTHELRTPLTTLQTHIEAMIDGVLKSDEKQLNSIYEEIIRLNLIVKDLDKLLQYDTNMTNLNKELTNMNDIIQSVMTLYEAAFLQKKVQLTYQPKNALIHVDKDKMSQVLINLLSNALKYTPSGQNVYIEVIDDIDSVTITVRDTGIGISEEDLPYIFDRFYRADKSRNRKTGGAGIGLSIVKSIIMAHKGTITPVSYQGIGTKFIIWLPKLREESL